MYLILSICVPLTHALSAYSINHSINQSSIRSLTHSLFTHSHHLLNSLCVSHSLTPCQSITRSFYLHSDCRPYIGLHRSCCLGRSGMGRMQVPRFKFIWNTSFIKWFSVLFQLFSLRLKFRICSLQDNYFLLRTVRLRHFRRRKKTMQRFFLLHQVRFELNAILFNNLLTFLIYSSLSHLIN
jgi:hypothetical protein